MKRSHITSLLAGVGILTGAQVALASDGLMMFKGELTGNTCNINVNGTGTSRDEVILPAVSTDTLATAGDAAGWTRFDIALTNCTGDAAFAMAYFEPGPTVDTATGLLKNTTAVSVAAKNVQIALRHADSYSNIIINGQAANQSPRFPIENGAATLRYQAGYWATDTTTSGAVTASVTYSIVYQ